jgi:primase-polymerase (primpol)-like protein
MSDSRCEYCGSSLLLLRSGARFCSTKCRVYSARAGRIPVEMTEKARWMRWTPVQRGDKITKRPVTVTGKAASSTNPETWAAYSDAKSSTAGVGLGFALGEGIGCIDLDHCIDNGVVAGWAQEILDAAPATYVEVSQSGSGLHIFGYLAEAPGRNIRDGVRSVEFYSAGRYIAVTGKRFESAPARLADLSEVVASVL